MEKQKDKYGFGIMPTIEDLNSYESPIQVACREVQNAFDNDVLKAVLSYGISVDKDELIRALQYDRKQYEKGFADGVHARLGEDAVPVVRCKDCKNWEDGYLGYCTKIHTAMDYDAFCSYGERRKSRKMVDMVRRKRFSKWVEPMPEPPIKKKRIIGTAKLREKSGMSQKALGKIVGKSQQAVAKWETGASEPDIETMFTLADVFGCTLEELFDEENQ